MQEDIKYRIMNDPINREYTAANIQPLYAINEKSAILIIGQAPGQVAQKHQIIWKDKSGDRLRDWLGVDEDTFYNSGKISVLPMDFYYPGKGKSGDLPPRVGIADKWHPILINSLKNLKLTILVGSYSQKYYLQLTGKDYSATEVIRHYRDYLPKYFPIIHPSPRNNIWLSRNPWFEEMLLPELKLEVKKYLV